MRKATSLEMSLNVCASLFRWSNQDSGRLNKLLRVTRLVSVNIYFYKEIKLVNPKGNQPCIFTGRTDTEAPILWPPDPKSWLIGKDSDAGKIEGRRKRGWQRTVWLDGNTDSMDMSLILRDGEGQGSLVCCSPWGHKELDMTERLNHNKRAVGRRKACKTCVCMCALNC